MESRRQFLKQVAATLIDLHQHGILKTAIDGIDAAGKTTLADELAVILESKGLEVIRASIDGFHYPSARRYARGKGSPEGYYLDSFNYPLLIDVLLRPLSPNGDRRIQRRAFDFRTDSPVTGSWELVSPEAILLFDGVFLLRPELSAYWDYRIFLDIEPHTSIERACRRDLDMFGSAAETERRYRQRYLAGQEIYLQTVQPRDQADLVIDHNDPAHPIVRKGRLDR